MFNRIKIICFLFLTLCYHVHGQHHDADSLKRVLEATSVDSIKLKVFNELAMSLRFSDPSAAENYGKQGLNILKDTTRAINKKKWAVLADNTAIPLAIQGKYEEAIEYFFLVLRIKESFNDSTGIASSYNNINNVYKGMGKLDQALVYAQKSYEVSKKLNDKKTLSLILNNLGSLYGAMNDSENALKIHYESISIKKEINDLEGLAYSYNNLTVIYKYMNNLDSALYYGNLTKALVEELNNYELIISNLDNLADIYTSFGEYEKALKALNKAIEISREKNYSQRLEMSYKYASATYEKMGKFEMALSYYKKARSISDSLLSLDYQKEIASLNTQYETEKKEQQIALQENQLKKERWFRYSIASGGGLILLFAVALLMGYKQKARANRKLSEAYSIIEDKNQNITSSIRYAKLIQQVVLPAKQLLDQCLPGEHFVFYKPKDIVSGDFYWIEAVSTTSENENTPLVFFAAADCTGHGVPGAMVSVICSNALTKAVKEDKLHKPSEVLNRVNEIVIEQFTKSESQLKDGMDVALCSFNTKSLKLQFSGANNPLYLIRKGELIETKGNKQPIGYTETPKSFTNHEVQLEKGDTIYMFTDGYADQFGGYKGKKYKYSKLKELLLSIEDKTMPEQKVVLDQSMEAWKGNLEQVDDILVIGIRV